MERSTNELSSPLSRGIHPVGCPWLGVRADRRASRLLRDHRVRLSDMAKLRACVVRCASCAAPLGDVGHTEVVACRYCTAENHVAQTPEALGTQAKRFQVAADEAKAMAADVQARGEALLKEYELLCVRVFARRAGPRAAGPQGVREVHPDAARADASHVPSVGERRSSHRENAPGDPRDRRECARAISGRRAGAPGDRDRCGDARGYTVRVREGLTRNPHKKKRAPRMGRPHRVTDNEWKLRATSCEPASGRFSGCSWPS